MILDAQGQFSDAQAVTASAASTNLIDLGVDGNLGIGEPMAVHVSLDVASDFTTGDETYVVTVETDDNSSFSSATTISTKTIVGANAAGSKFVLPIPADTSCERYVRVYFTQGGTSPTCTYTAFLVQQSLVQNDVVYANGYTIS